MTANSFIAVVEGRPGTNQFAIAFKGAGELLLALTFLPVFKARGLALLPRFNYPLSTQWLMPTLTGMNRNYKK